MKKFIENIIIIMVLTVVILFSYAVMEKKISGKSSSEFINFLFNTQEKSSDNKNTDKTSGLSPFSKCPPTPIHLSLLPSFFFDVR